MLINISNHPSDAWPVEQRDTALKLFKGILDIPFPKVDPEVDSSIICQLADDILGQVLKLAETHQSLVVHVMGEMTLTFALVCKLSSYGIKCVASTTKRVVSVQGQIKTAEFNFVRFREYLPCKSEYSRTEANE